MADKRTLIDTSIFIDFLRKKKKEDSLLWKLRETDDCFMYSVTLFELLSGAKTKRHFEDIKKLTKWIESIYFDDDIAEVAALIFRNLKQRNKVIKHRDIFITSTAKFHNFCIATLNTDHFKRIKGVVLLDIFEKREKISKNVLRQLKYILFSRVG